MTLYTWSKTAATNATIDSTINWAEGQAPSSINDSARSTMAAVAKFRDDTNGSITAGGTSTAFTATSNQVFDTLAHLDKQELTVIFNVTSGASPTLNVDSLGAKALNVRSGVAVPTGYFKAGTPYRLTFFNSTNEFIPQGQADALSLGGTLAATGAATLSGGAAVTNGTTTDTLSVTSTSTLTGKATFASTDSMAVAKGTTGQRNGSPTAGDFRYNSTNNAVEYWNGSSWISPTGLPRGHIDGLVLSNDGGTPNTVIDLAAGSCRSDDNTTDLTLAALTKSIGSTWVSGTGNGSLDTGAVAANSTYAVFVIYNPTTLATDALLSKSTAGSFASPTMPSGYTKKRYIGSILTDASSHVISFSQVGDEFLLNTMLTRTPSIVSGSRTLVTLGDGTTPGVPAGVKVLARIRANFSSANGQSIIITSPDESDQANSLGELLGGGGGGITVNGCANVLVRTNMSQQIGLRGSINPQTSVYGWVDQRGKNS